MYAHEAGHLLGFDDVYNDYVKQADGTWKSGDQTLTSEKWAQLYKERGNTDLTEEQLKQWADCMPVNSSTSIPMEGHEGDLMADKSGSLSTRHFDELASKAGVIVEVRPGDILVNKNGENQNLVNTRAENIFTENGETKVLEGLWVACIDTHQGIPSMSDITDIAPHPSQWHGIEAALHLQKLLDYVNAKDLYCGWDFATQWAIWRITDNQSDAFTAEYADTLLTSAGISLGDRLLDFPRLVSPADDEATSRFVTPVQLYILNAPNVSANPGTDVTLTGTLMAPVPEGLSTEFFWALLSKPPDSEASLSMLKQNTGILEEFPSSEVSFVPDVRGLYAFEVAVSINIANQPDVTIPPGRVSLTAADELTETFETGALTGGTFFWHTGGNVPWEISDDYSHTGRYAARSGNIGDDQQSSIEIPIIVAEQAGISFSLRVSSEEGFDVLKFYIDDQLQNEWSGNIDWTSVSYTLSAGERRLKWQYEKDSSFSDGFDRAWIDDIFFPLSTTGVSTGSAIPTEYKL